MTCPYLSITGKVASYFSERSVKKSTHLIWVTIFSVCLPSCPGNPPSPGGPGSPTAPFLEIRAISPSSPGGPLSPVDINHARVKRPEARRTRLSCPDTSHPVRESPFTLLNGIYIYRLRNISILNWFSKRKARPFTFLSQLVQTSDRPVNVC